MSSSSSDDDDDDDGGGGGSKRQEDKLLSYRRKCAETTEGTWQGGEGMNDVHRRGGECCCVANMCRTWVIPTLTYWRSIICMCRLIFLDHSKRAWPAFMPLICYLCSFCFVSTTC